MSTKPNRFKEQNYRNGREIRTLTGLEDVLLPECCPFECCCCLAVAYMLVHLTPVEYSAQRLTLLLLRPNLKLGLIVEKHKTSKTFDSIFTID